MASNVTKWQNWGLISALHLLLNDTSLCDECRQRVFKHSAMWGVQDELVNRMAYLDHKATLEDM